MSGWWRKTLEDVGGQAERGGQGKDAGRQQKERCDQRAQEDDEQQELDASTARATRRRSDSVAPASVGPAACRRRRRPERPADPCGASSVGMAVSQVVVPGDALAAQRVDAFKMTRNRAGVPSLRREAARRTAPACDRLADADQRRSEVLLLRAEHAGDVGPAGELRLERHKRERCEPEAGLLHDDLGRREDAGGKAGARRRGRAGRLARGRQAGGQTEPELARAMPVEASTSTATPTTVTITPTGRRRGEAGKARPHASAAGRPAYGLARAGSCRRAVRPEQQPCRRWPAGRARSVIATTSPTSTVSAKPGPRARKNDSEATVRQAVPAATMMPAARMVGRNSAVVARRQHRGAAPRPAVGECPTKRRSSSR